LKQNTLVEVLCAKQNTTAYDSKCSVAIITLFSDGFEKARRKKEERIYI
jgi:hypothetical protein